MCWSLLAMSSKCCSMVSASPCVFLVSFNADARFVEVDEHLDSCVDVVSV